MHNIDKAIEDLAEIRSQIASSRTFKGFGASVIAGTGVLAMLVLIFQIKWPELFAPTPYALVLVWILAAVISVASIGAEMFARSRRHHGHLANSMLINAVENFLPVGMTGAVIGIVILKIAPDIVWVLPGIWQMLVSIAVFSSLRFMPRSILVVAGWYFICGAVTLIIGANSHAISPWMMGIPFMFGQWIMAFILYQALEKNDV